MALSMYIYFTITGSSNIEDWCTYEAGVKVVLFLKTSNRSNQNCIQYQKYVNQTLEQQEPFRMPRYRELFVEYDTNYTFHILLLMVTKELRLIIFDLKSM